VIAAADFFTTEVWTARGHRERNHQGLGNDLIEGVGGARTVGTIRRRQRLGGLRSYDYRAA
jgi:hypothetical protein